MDDQKEEAAMSEKIVKGGPSKAEAQQFNAPKKVVHRPRLSIADRIALGLSGLGTVALAGTVIDAQNQTPPPQVTPDQRGLNPPPEGVRLAPQPDSSAPSTFRVLLPQVTNKYQEAPPSPAELFFRSLKVIDAISTTYNDRTYIAETLVTPAATYKVTIKEELKERVARLVAQDGEKYQFTGAKIIIASSKDEIPEGVTMGTSFIRLGGEPPNAIGTPLLYLGGQRVGDQVILYIVPNYSLPLNDPVIQERIHDKIADQFARLIYSGGAIAFVNIAGQTEHINLINQHPFQLSSR